MSNSSKPESDESEWLVHTCPHCDGPFKSRAEAQTPQMACPHCGEVVQLRAPSEEEEAEAGSDSPGDGESVPETGEGASPSEDEDDDLVEELTTEAEGEIRKKRRKHLKEYNLDWDAENKGRASEGESDEEDDIREYYEVDPDDPEAVRIRRVRKKKLLTGGEKLIRYIVIGSITAVLVGTGVVGSMIWFQSVKQATKDVGESGEIPVTIQKLIKEAVEADAISSIVTREEEAACKAIIEGFEEAQSVGNKLSFVRLPDRVKPLFEERYEGKPHTPDVVKEIHRTNKLIENDRYFITLAAEMTPSGKIRFFAFEQTKDSILMDWEVSYSYQEMPLEEFMDQRPTEDVIFRVRIQKANELGEGFGETEGEYEPVILSYPGDLEFRLRGHVKTGEPWAARLLARLEFQAPSMVLRLKYPPDAESRYDVEITGVENDSWFY